MGNPVYKLKQTGTYLDGRSLINQIKEIELPEIEWDTVEHEAIGSIGVGAHPRRIPVLEATVMMAGYSPLLAKAAADPSQPIMLQTRSAYSETLAGTQTRTIPRIITMRGRFLKYGLGSINQSDDNESETMMAVDYLKEVWDGGLILEYSYDANIYRTANIDFLASQRTIVGF